MVGGQWGGGRRRVEGKVTAQLCEYSYLFEWSTGITSTTRADTENGNKYEMRRNAAHFVKASRPLQVAATSRANSAGNRAIVNCVSAPFRLLFIVTSSPFFSFGSFGYSFSRVGVFVSYRFVAWLRVITCRCPRQRMQRLYRRLFNGIQFRFYCVCAAHLRIMGYGCLHLLMGYFTIGLRQLRLRLAVTIFAFDLFASVLICFFAIAF